MSASQKPSILGPCVITANIDFEFYLPTDTRKLHFGLLARGKKSIKELFLEKVAGPFFTQTDAKFS
jgi:hypothetical protein